MALTERQLNRALLARQLLLDRAATPLPDVLERIAGIQAQYAPAMYVGLWSRVDGLTRDGLTRALEERRVIQATLMRSTIHLVSPRDFWPFAIATRDARREGYLRNVDVSAREMTAAARTVAERLAAGPATRRELEELVGKDRARGVGLWHDMVRVPPSGTWERRRADLYGDAAQWLTPEPIDPAAAIEHLVRRYLRAFGPATRHDVAGFTGLKLTALKPALGQMERLDGDLLDVPDAPRPDPDTPAPVRFLPVWDATLLVHARRTGVLPEQLRPRVFSVRRPHGTPTFLIDGAVAGEWRYEDGRVALDPWTKLDPASRRALAEEAERLAAFHR